MEDRQKLSAMLKSYSVSSFDGKVDDVIQMLANDRDKFIGEGYFDVYLSAEQYYDDVEIYLRASRYENDREYAARKEHEKKIKEREKVDKKKRDAAEKALYEKLKKKYEGK